MKIEYKKISDLKPYARNPRKNDDAVDYVANSIKEFGFIVPVVIDNKNYTVVGSLSLGGEGRYLCLYLERII